jgi:hypothetical protein
LHPFFIEGVISILIAAPKTTLAGSHNRFQSVVFKSKVVTTGSNELCSHQAEFATDRNSTNSKHNYSQLIAGATLRIGLLPGEWKDPREVQGTEL